MCFNLFGHFQEQPERNALLGWVRRHDAAASKITRVEIEWAPPSKEHFGGGSAFDAFVEYEIEGDHLGFLAVECKYHEHLPRTDVKSVRATYREFTEAHGLWSRGACKRLDRTGLRQFWLNTLLAQSLLRTGQYASARSVIIACAEDRSARDACAAVRSELTDPHTLAWDPWEAVVASIDGHDAWRDLFVSRYLDFRPVTHVLADGDPRRTPRVSVVTALAIAIRVLGDGSVLEQLEESGRAAPLPWSRLDVITDELKRLRVDAGRVLGGADARGGACLENREAGG